LALETSRFVAALKGHPRLGTAPSIRIIAVLILLTTASIYALPPILYGTLNYPPEPGDGPDYDAIAFQLVKGEGFSYNWDNPEYRAPYLALPDRYEYLLQRSGARPTAYRPPLLPAAMAVSYFLFGRNFAIVRMMDCWAMALTSTIFFTVVARRFGVRQGLLFIAFLVLDGWIGYYARFILTESIACLLVALLTWSLMRLAEQKQATWAILAGIFSGAAVLNRTVFALWVPIISISIYILTCRRTAKWLDWGAVRLAGMFLIVSTALCIPWAIRNTLLLRAFSPLGTQGDINLSAAYSDKAVANEGMWFDLESTGFFDTIFSSGTTGLELEKATANYSRAMALEWIKDNPHLLPLLMALKTYNLWKPSRPWDKLVLFLVLAGILLYPNKTELFVYLVLLLTNTLAIALTWTVGDSRFLVPVLPIVFVVASVGLGVSIRRIIHGTAIFRKNEGSRLNKSETRQIEQ
jgi:4-amino-4-deoxy-L-arabinose transferase-like glycosyltransferase